MFNFSHNKTFLQHASKLLLETLTTPLMPVDYAGLLNPLRGREIRGRVVESRQFGRFTEVTLQTSPSFDSDFHAGQFVGLGVQIEGRWQWRCYSITNAPARTENNPRKSSPTITLGITAVPDGAVSTHVSSKLSPGDVIRLTAPGGNFHLTAPVPAHILFITAGAGITPVMSMLRWLHQEMDDTQFPDVIHIHSERTGKLPAPYTEEIAKLVSDRSKYSLRMWNSSEQGRLKISQLEELVPDVADREIYGCGPQPMLDALCRTFPNAHVERFSSAPEAPGDARKRGGQITFAGLDAVIECDPSTTILEAADSAGVSLMHGCRMGICHTCVASVVDGEAIDTRTGSVHSAGERLRTCSSVPSGDVIIKQ